MQPEFPRDTDKHSPQVGPGMADSSANLDQEQADQWAVLRHEVEDETVTRNDERAGAARLDWDERNTEDDSLAAQNPYDFEMSEQALNHVNIVVAGVGGAGMNAVNRMIAARVRGVRFVAMNTDAQVLDVSQAPTRICLMLLVICQGLDGVLPRGLHARNDRSQQRADYRNTRRQGPPLGYIRDLQGSRNQAHDESFCSKRQ
jgi:hypothetical protein